jgi:hypothetical protein
MRTLHHHPIIITHHPTAKHVPSDAHFIIITQQSTPNTQAKTCSLRCGLYIISQQSTPITQQP